MSNYLDTQHQAEVSEVLNTFTARTEWPTWLLIIGFYSAWCLIIFHGRALGPFISISLLLPLIVLWMSLQHECIHGHPTRLPALNKALAYLPFAVWYPYNVYRDTHLAHHVDETLTVPGIDPESRYISAADWEYLPTVQRFILWTNKTVAGRLLTGVPLAIASLVFSDIPKSIQRRDESAHMWAFHIAWVAVMLWTVEHYSAVSAWEYVVFVSIPALAIGMIRSFYEHRPSERAEHRTVINESKGLLSWLFLNLNFHLVHHDLPKLPWYCLPTVYHARRQQWIERNGVYVVRNYRQLFFNNFLTPIDSPVHPLPTRQAHERPSVNAGAFE
ncbi:fatty acid desaturase [Pseudomonas sp. RC10]|uniref:fatty acid desaturase n=1 Tax=Pseudomonas bambusae TaxID=3139142 RepID=UPI00313A35F8